MIESVSDKSDVSYLDLYSFNRDMSAIEFHILDWQYESSETDGPLGNSAFLSH